MDCIFATQLFGPTRLVCVILVKAIMHCIRNNEYHLCRHEISIGLQIVRGKGSSENNLKYYNCNKSIQIYNLFLFLFTLQFFA